MPPITAIASGPLVSAPAPTPMAAGSLAFGALLLRHHAQEGGTTADFATTVATDQEIVAEKPANGDLRRVLPQWQGTLVSVYALAETRPLPSNTHRFIGFLCEHLGQH